MVVHRLREKVPIIVGASHNRSQKTRSQLDQIVLSDAEGYRRKNRVSSDKMIRSIHDDVDESKFNAEIVDYMTSVEIMLLSFALSDFAKFDLLTVGNKETGKDVADVNKFLRENYDGVDQTAFIREGTPTSLDGTVRSGVNGLGNPEKYAFITGDLVFPDRINVLEQFQSFNPKQYALWLDLNAIKKIMPTDELKLFDRNCYASIIQDGELLPNKEPNLDLFSSRYKQWEAMNIAYTERAGGKLMKILTFYELLKHREPDENRTQYSPGRFATAIIRSLYHTTKNWQKTFRQDDAEVIFSTILGNDIHLTALHNDPWLLRDIDAYHDLVFYRLLASHIKEHGGWKSIFEPRVANALEQYAQFQAQQPEEVKQERILKYDQNTWFRRRVFELNIKEYQDGNDIKVQPRPDEDLDKCVAQLQNRYRQQQLLLNAA